MPWIAPIGFELASTGFLAFVDEADLTPDWFLESRTDYPILLTSFDYFLELSVAAEPIKFLSSF